MTTLDDPINAAARWLSAQPGPIPHVIPALKERFGLTGLQACQAIALARNVPIPSYPDFVGEVAEKGSKA